MPEIAWCQDHGVRGQDGVFIHRGERCCNQTVRKEGGVPILCSHALKLIPTEEERFVDDEGDVFIRECVLPDDCWWGYWENSPMRRVSIDPRRTRLTPEPPDYPAVLAELRAELAEPLEGDRQRLVAAAQSVVRKIDALLPSEPLGRTVPEKLRYIAAKLREEASMRANAGEARNDLLVYSLTLDEIAEDVDD
jgi:hypothetical protein